MPFTLPDLPYAHNALEPHVDERTMQIHHGKHHAGYTNKLNAALEGIGLEDRDIEDLLANLSDLPADKQTAVRNNGGGYLNHAIFWTVMSPNGGGEAGGALGAAIASAFGSFDAFKEQFAAAAGSRFGSGWAWLVLNASNELEVVSYPNQDAPVMDGKRPIIGLDVWEHAYYLNYQNRRPDYVAAFWNVANWEEAGRRYDMYMAG